MIRDGVRYVRDRPVLKMVLIAGFFAGTFGMNFQMTSALMATQVFGKGASEYGLLGTTLAIGSLTGRAARCPPRRQAPATAGHPRRPRLRGDRGGDGPDAHLPDLRRRSPRCSGCSLLTMLNAANTTVQLSTEPQMRGRVMALYMTLIMGGTPVGSPLIGWIGATFGARWTLIGGGLMSLFGVALAALVYRGLKGPWFRFGRRVPPSGQETADELLAA